MWHEARRQERKIRGMLVDYRRRAERRRDFYEKIKADPTQFLQIHGRQCRIHLDPAIAAAADSSSAMMPWQGQSDNLIDRFDVRAHLDFIPQVKKEEEEPTIEERQINYERYRIIAQNSFLAINEEKFLKQLHLEEQFGYTETRTSKKEQQRVGGAAIGFNYEENSAPAEPLDPINEEESDDNSDSDLDVDLSINVSKMDAVQAHEMNRHGRGFGMSSNDFYSFLTNDLEEAESFRLAKEEEHEKALFSGRKSRRERRAHREKRLANRVISPPSYAAPNSPTPAFRNKSKSPSKSPSPEVNEKITYITSFGDEEEAPSTSKIDKSKHKNCKRSSSDKVVYISKKKRSRSRDRNRRRNSRSRSNRSRSKNRKRTRSRDRYKESRPRSKGRSYRRKRSSSSSTRSSSSRSASRTKSRSKSAIRAKTKSKTKSPPPPPLQLPRESPPKLVSRYYGRKKSDQSSSELSDASSEKNDDKVGNNSPGSNEKWSGCGNSGIVTKKTGPSATIQERLKRKRQALLNKQFKADKIAEQIKTEREKQEQQHREDELREMAIKLRRRQREKRHAYDSNRSSCSSDSGSEKSQSAPVEPDTKSPSPRRDRGRRSRDRSRERRASRSPARRNSYRERRERNRDNYDRERNREYRRDERDRREERESRGLVDY